MQTNSFASLKSSNAMSIDTLQTEMKKLDSGGYQADENEWQPTAGKDGNGYAVVRFLPTPAGNKLPFVRIWSHGFKGPRTGQWYIEKSLTSIGKDDPVGEMNTELWNSGDAGKKIVSGDPGANIAGTKRKLQYVANVLIVNDPAHPELNGTVKKYKFGKKIYDKIEAAMKPEFPDQEPINVFDLWNGADFRIKITREGRYRSYDKSDFAAPSAVFGGDDAKLEALWKKEFDLEKEYLDESTFKTYDELKARLDRVWGNTPATVATGVVDQGDAADELGEGNYGGTPQFGNRRGSTADSDETVPVTNSGSYDTNSVSASNSADDDGAELADLSYFENLRNDTQS